MLKNITWYVIIMLSIAHIVYGLLPLDNEITGEPVVNCGDSQVGLEFNTRKPFMGRVYVQGMSDDDRCSKSYADENNSSMALMVRNGECTMQRHRVTGKVEGLMFSMTVVVSFHGTFVTKADRAFRCICFFRSQNPVANSIQMGSMPTTELVGTIKMPTCSYGIHAGSIDGPPVVFGEVGQKIFHVWQCDDNTKGFLVHSCTVTDRRGLKFDLVDEDGCAVDPVIQPEITYDSTKSRAVAETFGYKFSDTATLDYECVLELCDRAAGDCDNVTPPSCSRDSEPFPEPPQVVEFASNSTEEVEEVEEEESEEVEEKYRRRRRRRDQKPGTLSFLPRSSTGQQMAVVASINMVDNLKSVTVTDDVNENATIPLAQHLDAINERKANANDYATSSKICFAPLHLIIIAIVLFLLLLLCTGIMIYLSRYHTYVLYSK